MTVPREFTAQAELTGNYPVESRILITEAESGITKQNKKQPDPPGPCPPFRDGEIPTSFLSWSFLGP